MLFVAVYKGGRGTLSHHPQAAMPGSAFLPVFYSERKHVKQVLILLPAISLAKARKCEDAPLARIITLHKAKRTRQHQFLD
jgi:hypothetical protein